MPSTPNCPSTVSQTRPEYSWLCVEHNREGHAFLESVHESLHRYGRLTERQLEAVRQWIRRDARGRQRELSHPPVPVSELLEAMPDPLPSRRRSEFDLAGLLNWDRWMADTTPTVAPPLVDIYGNLVVDHDVDRVEAIHHDSTQYEYNGRHNVTHRWSGAVSNRAALWNEAQWVYNGEFEVHGVLVMRFKIHTLVQASREELVGRRAVSVMQNGTWKAFASVSITGHLQVWRAWQGEENRVMIRYAQALMDTMRDEDLPEHSATWGMSEEAEGESYTLEGEWIFRNPLVLCRRCNNSFNVLTEAEDTENGVHDEDCTARIRSAFTPRRRRPISGGGHIPPMQRTALTDHGTVEGFRYVPGIVHQEAHTGPIMSELGSDWER